MASDRVHLSVAEAREHAERALAGIGYDAEEARILADHMIDAALCGYEYSGLAKILNIPEHRRFKRPRAADQRDPRDRGLGRCTTAATMSACWRCIMPPARRSPRQETHGFRARRRHQQLDERAQRLLLSR